MFNQSAVSSKISEDYLKNDTDFTAGYQFALKYSKKLKVAKWKFS